MYLQTKNVTNKKLFSMKINYAISFFSVSTQRISITGNNENRLLASMLKN